MQVAKVVAPKKAALKEAEASYEEVMVGLRAKQAELKVWLPSQVTQKSMHPCVCHTIQANWQTTSVCCIAAEQLQDVPQLAHSQCNSLLHREHIYAHTRAAKQGV